MKNLAKRLMIHAAIIGGAIAAGHMDMTDVVDLKASSIPMQNVFEMPSQPLVFEEDGKLKVNDFMKEMQTTLLSMNNLSYTLAKDEKHLAASIDEMEKLQNEGWVVRGFTGLEGARSTYSDLSGFVAYHPEQNVISVVYHGTAGNTEGWDTNYAGNKIYARQLKDAYLQDFFDEVTSQTTGTKVGKNIFNSLNKFAKQCKADGTMTVENIRVLQEKINAKMMKHPNSKTLGNLLSFCDIRLDLLKSLETYNASGLSGEIHSGFLKKYISTKREVLELIKETTSKLTADQKKDLKIVFTGHSQAGATANLALADICKNHGSEIFGEGFDNKKSNNMMGYFLSAARVGDEDYKEMVHQSVGEQNIIRQNVAGDPVPVALADSKLSELMTQVPAIKIALSDFLNYDDTGILLLDDANETWGRAKQMHMDNGKNGKDYDGLEDALRYFLSFGIDESKIPEFLVSSKKDPSFFGSPVKWISKRNEARKLFNLMNAARKGDEKAVKKLTNLFADRLAHLHYGFNREEVGAVFNPGVVGKDLDSMLERGVSHEAKRNSATPA